MLTKGARRLCPRSGAGQQIAYTTTAANTALDTDLPGNFVTVKNLSTAQVVRVLFGNSATTVSYAATSGATLGFELAAGETQDWYLTKQDTHIAHDGDGSGNLQIWSSG